MVDSSKVKATINRQLQPLNWGAVSVHAVSMNTIYKFICRLSLKYKLVEENNKLSLYTLSLKSRNHVQKYNT